MSAYVKLGPRRRWPTPSSGELNHALICKNPNGWELELLRAITGAYFALVYSPRRKREADIALLRKLTARARKGRR